MSDDTPKLRLRPKLAPDAPAAPPAPPSPAASTPQPAPAPAPAPAPIPTPPSLAAPTVPPPVVRLTPRAPVQPPPIPQVAPAVAAPATVVVAPASQPPTDPATPPVAAPGETDPALAAKKVQRVALGIGIAGMVVFVAIGAIAYPRLIAETKAIADAEERFTAAMRKAQEEEEQAAKTPASSTGEAVAPSAPAPAPAAATPANPQRTPSAPNAPAPAAAASPGPAPDIAVGAPAAGADPFQAWVTSLKISGVRTGRVPRVLIGSKAFNQGEVVNAELGVTFDGYDADRHLVRFRDSTGRVLERRDR